MSILEGELISGAGGKGGGGGHQPVEATDTLRSQQVVKLLLAVGEGEIQSIDDVLLNKVSISNYKASWSYNTGTASQAVIKGFIDTEAPYTLSSAPIQNKDSITHVVKPVGSYSWSFNGTVDAVRLTLTLSGLRKLLDNGDLVGYSVNFNIYSKATLSSNFSLVTSSTKKGKASSNYSWDIIVKRPDTTGSTDSWQVAIERTTVDDPSTKYSSVTNITAITQIYYKQLTYPNTSLVYIEIKDAIQFGGQVPAVLIKGKGRKVLIPSNYNPTTRVYTGIWDLGMNPVKQFTSNIAWVIYDVLRDSSCLGLDSSEVDRVSFYQLSKYADELVPDGYGGTIPRYTAGYQYYTRQNVQTFLQNLLSLCNANLTTNEFGQVAIIFDQPNISPSRLVTNSNVVNGIFNYSSNDLENRYSLVNVTYNNFKSYSETDTATWSDDSLISRYGLQTNDILLPGCINEAQAIRKARWAVYTNAITTRLLTFNIGFEALSYKTGSVIKVMDSDNADVIQHGIIKGSSLVTGTTTFTLDKSITLANIAYTITFYLADGVTLVTRTILQTNATVSSISFTGTDVPLIGSTFILSSTVVPQLYKVVGITKNDTDYTISCIVHDETKFTYIDGAVSLTSPANDFVNITNFTVEPVTNLTVTPISFTTGTLSNIQLHVSWDWNLTGTATYHATYEASWSRDNQDALYISSIEGQSFDINSIVPGSYTINVWSINPISGIKSAITSIIYNYRTSAGSSNLFPPINPRVAGTSYVSGTIPYSTPALALAFDYNTANDAVVADSLLDYVVELWDSAGATLIRSYIVQPDISRNGLFNLPLMENISAFGGATRTYQLKLYSRDLTGFVSTALGVTVANAAPSTQSFTLIAGISSVFINITTTPELDTTGYQVYRSITSGFTPGVTSDALLPVYDGPDTYITLNVPDTNTWYYKIAAYDSFGKIGLTFSSQTSSTALSADATRWSLSGITFSIGATNRIDWTAGSIVKNGSTTYTIAASSYTWTAGIVYIYFNPTASTTALQTTTTLATAVGVGCYPIATYTGGAATNIKGGDGSAFISGSQLVAGTVGTSQLVAGSVTASILDTTNAIITGTAQIADGIISNAKIGSIISSTNYNPATHQGWQLDKAGNIVSYGTLNILDSTGATVLSTGASPSMDFSYIGGSTKPANNATVGANLQTTYAITPLSSLTAGQLVLPQNATYVAATGVLTRNAWSNTAITPTAITIATDIITSATNTLTTGTKVTYTCTTTPITGLVKGQEYYVVFFSTTTFKLATTYANAMAATPVVIDLTSVTITAGSVFNIAGVVPQWDTEVHSNFTQTGSAKVTFTITSITNTFAVGLDTTPLAGNSYTNIDICFYIINSDLYIYQNGTMLAGFNPVAINDALTILYTGTTMYFCVNGALIYTLTVASGSVYYLQACLNTVGSGIGTLGFGAYVVPTQLTTPNMSGQMTASTISTYIANASIQTAQIGDLSVNTLQIAGNAVVVPVGTNFITAISGSLAGLATVWKPICSITIDMTGGTNNNKIIINGFYDGYTTGTFPGCGIAGLKIFDELGTQVTSSNTLGTSSPMYSPASIAAFVNGNSVKTFTLQVGITNTSSVATTFNYNAIGIMSLIGAKSSV